MPAFSQLTSQYDRFLFAPILEQKGVPLSLLSVLARLDIDPRQEAARLATLSKDEATNSLSSTIWKANSERLSASEASVLAARLIEFLPCGDNPPVGPSAANNHEGIFLMLFVQGLVWSSLILASTNIQQSKTTVGDGRHKMAVAQQPASPPPTVNFSRKGPD